MKSIDARLPTFIIIGAAKCGTTSLASYVALHPDVWVCDPKEPDYFVGKHDGHGGELELYKALFDGGSAMPIRGEASTTYTRFPSFDGVPARMHAVLPRVRLVYLIRDPFERIESHYLMRLRQGRTQGDITSVVRRNPEYVDVSRYGLQISKYLEHYETNQILVLRLEDLAADPTSAVANVLSFIGADPARGPASYTYHLNSRPLGPQRRPVRVPTIIKPVLHLSPRRFRSSLKSRVTRSLPEAESAISPDLKAELTDVFRSDLVLLKELVAPEFGLYGLA